MRPYSNYTDYSKIEDKSSIDETPLVGPVVESRAILKSHEVETAIFRGDFSQA